MAILKLPTEQVKEISDGFEYAIERSYKIKSFRIRNHCRYANQFEILVEMNDTSILYIDCSDKRKILSFVRRHKFLGLPVRMDTKVYLYEPGNYLVGRNKYGKIVLGEISYDYDGDCK